MSRTHVHSPKGNGPLPGVTKADIRAAADKDGPN